LGGRLGLGVGAEASRADAAVGRRDEGEQGVEPTTAVAAARQVTVIGMGHITWASRGEVEQAVLGWSGLTVVWVQLLLGWFLVRGWFLFLLVAPLVDIYLLKHSTRYTIINS
jgi:hypothetical protein